MSSPNHRDFLRFENWSYRTDLVSFDISGPDALRYLQGQVTQDLNILKDEQCQLAATLELNGRVQSFFHIQKIDVGFKVYVAKEMAQNLWDRLNKFIIMDEVELSIIDESVLYINTSLCAKPINIFFEDLIISKNPMFSEISPHDFKMWCFYKGYPTSIEEVLSEPLLNNTLLEENAISYKKGCFLGQETVAKIYTRRGAAVFPCLIQLPLSFEINKDTNIFIGDEKCGKVLDIVTLENEQLIKISLKREYRIESRKFDFKINNQTYTSSVEFFPLWKESNSHEKSMSLYNRACDLYVHENNVDKAKKYFELSLEYDQNLEDCYEAYGVMLGNLGEYEKAINLMMKLSQINPKLVMPHTNMSMFYMKMGKIEEAEKEKSEATFKSFSYFGDEAKQKKIKEEQKQQELEKLKERESMFLQVLEIDEEDLIANNGLAEIYLARKDYERSINLYLKVLKINENHSVAYLGLGQAYLENNKYDLARVTFEKGIEIASRKGELKPANEMQSLLLKIEE